MIEGRLTTTPPRAQVRAPRRACAGRPGAPRASAAGPRSATRARRGRASGARGRRPQRRRDGGGRGGPDAAGEVRVPPRRRAVAVARLAGRRRRAPAQPRPTRAATAPQGWAMTSSSKSSSSTVIPFARMASTPALSVAASHSIVRSGSAKKAAARRATRGRALPANSSSVAARHSRTRFSKLETRRARWFWRSITITVLKPAAASASASAAGVARLASGPPRCCGLMCVSAALLLRFALPTHARSAAAERPPSASPPCGRGSS